MSGKFDPYHRWLGIPAEEQPPHHYRLLGLAPFEADPEVIRDAAERQMAHVRGYALGRHAELSQRILNELAAAKACLSEPAKKAGYDRQLRAQLTPKKAATASPRLPPPPLPPTGAPSTGSIADEQWYYEALGEAIGPFTFSELAQKAASDIVSPDARIRRGTSGPWIRARSVKGLFDVPVRPVKTRRPERPVVEIAAEQTPSASQSSVPSPTIAFQLGRVIRWVDQWLREVTGGECEGIRDPSVWVVAGLAVAAVAFLITVSFGFLVASLSNGREPTAWSGARGAGQHESPNAAISPLPAEERKSEANGTVAC